VAARADLLEVLARARRRGFLGPGDPAGHLEHALGFAEVAEALVGRPPERIADLGTGGGVPGLVLAWVWAEPTLVLVESSETRAGWLQGAAAELDLADRVEVCCRRAEDLAHEPEHRERFGLVTARSFGAPAVTAEVASGLVSVGGWLLVSEPPEAADRWPARPLAELGLAAPELRGARGAHYAGLRKRAAAPARFPRRRGQAAKRPLWEPGST
jgi:16S rRNA (guanine527-N7)-methyltransferase